MKLVYARPSPFVRKVMVVLEEAGRTDEFELVDGFGSPVAPNENAIMANPVGKIPCLILDNGQSLYDSRVITRYLDSMYDLGLYPGGEAQWTTLTLESHADAMLDAGVISVYELSTRWRVHGWSTSAARSTSRTSPSAACWVTWIFARRWAGGPTGEPVVRH